MPFFGADYFDEDDGFYRPTYSLKPGTWWIECKSDQRFNICGFGLVGGLVMSPDAKKKLDETVMNLSTPVPDDAIYGFMKDCGSIAQRIEHLTSNQSVGGSNPSGTAKLCRYIS